MKKIFFLFLVAIALTGCQLNSQDQELTNTILFYRNDCSHCKNVEQYLAENKIRDRVKFLEKEVSTNQKNQDLLIYTATKKCQIDVKEIGVPFLWDNGQCYSGDEQIIDFFRNK